MSNFLNLSQAMDPEWFSFFYLFFPTWEKNRIMYVQTFFFFFFGLSLICSACLENQGRGERCTFAPRVLDVSTEQWTSGRRAGVHSCLQPWWLMSAGRQESRRSEKWKKKQYNVPDSSALPLLVLGWRQWDPLHLWRLSSNDWQWTQTGSLSHSKSSREWLCCVLCSLKCVTTAS